jgi:hypothetical protein
MTLLMPDTAHDQREYRLRCGAGAFLATALMSLSAWAQGAPEFELVPIHYSARTPTNRLTGLEPMVAARLPAGSDREFLKWFLGAAGVPAESQVLVFSKTSLQRNRIHPRMPRALFFSDDLYVGWVPGGLVELTVADPALGLVFYQLDPRASAPEAGFQREAACLSCHAGSMTRNLPGLILRSVHPDERGEPIVSAGSSLVGHDTPFERRWGGWYVTGQHGTARHLGNETARVTAHGVGMDVEAGANLTTLEGRFPAGLFLRTDSDLVALMVLEHQVLTHNRLNEGALRVRRWSHYQRELRRELGDPPVDEPVGTALRVVQNETERIVEALLFVDEIALPEGGIRGAGDFEKAFVANRRLDPDGRSLKDFDLQTRLFRWRCSYLIYSEAFDYLPAELRWSVLRRLDEVLLSTTAMGRFAHLPADERRAIREILLSTHVDFAKASRL